MKIIISYIFFLLPVITSCGQQVSNEFPNEIKTVKTNHHIRLEGTKVLGVMPKDYSYVKELARYQKNDNLYIQVIESNSSSFNQAKSDITKEKIESQGAKVDIIKNIRFNEFEAIYSEVPSKYQGETKLMLMFGDDSVYVIIAGVYKTADIKGKKELQDIIKAIYYDKSFEINPLELANFEFDQSITNFKYAATVSNMFMYAENGKEDLQNTTNSSMHFSALPQMTAQQGEDFIKDMLWRYEKNGFTLENKNIVKTTISNYSAFVLETNINYQNSTGIIYKAILMGEKSTVLFIAIAYKDIGNNIEKFKKTAQTIKIK